MLCTENFVFRPLVPSDALHFVAAVNESSLTLPTWMPWAHARYSQTDADEWIDRCQQEWRDQRSFQFGIFDNESDVFVGGCGLNQFNHKQKCCNLGYWVRQSCQRRGAATQAVRALSNFAFKELELGRVEIVVAVGNSASLGVARKAGAIEECIARNRLKLGEVFVDAHVLALTPNTF